MNKRGRPPVGKRSFSNDASFSNIKKEQQQQHQEEQPLPPTKVRRTSTTNRSTMDGKLYCVCRKPYDATRFMIACDRCDDWFHGECIGISEKESEFVDLYFCTKCSKSESSSLYIRSLHTLIHIFYYYSHWKKDKLETKMRQSSMSYSSKNWISFRSFIQILFRFMRYAGCTSSIRIGRNQTATTG